jgi:FkbM family methyltransferase
MAASLTEVAVRSIPARSLLYLAPVRGGRGPNRENWASFASWESGCVQCRLNCLPQAEIRTPPFVGEETIAMHRLDGVFDQYVRAGEVAFLKLDVQGYELHVLAGATGVTHRIAAI